MTRFYQIEWFRCRNDYYSGDWASFHFESLRKWIAQRKVQLQVFVLHFQDYLEVWYYLELFYLLCLL